MLYSLHEDMDISQHESGASQRRTHQTSCASNTWQQTWRNDANSVFVVASTSDTRYNRSHFNMWCLPDAGKGPKPNRTCNGLGYKLGFAYVSGVGRSNMVLAYMPKSQSPDVPTPDTRSVDILKPAKTMAKGSTTYAMRQKSL